MEGGTISLRPCLFSSFLYSLSIMSKLLIEGLVVTPDIFIESFSALRFLVPKGKSPNCGGSSNPLTNSQFRSLWEWAWGRLLLTDQRRVSIASSSWEYCRDWRWTSPCRYPKHFHFSHEALVSPEKSSLPEHCPHRGAWLRGSRGKD